jgi:hypothetical protein
MKNKNHAHWVLKQIAESQAPGADIDLWSQIRKQLSLRPRQNVGKATTRHLKTRYAFMLVLLFLIVGSVIFVPSCRAFVEDVIQRMGIAFVNTERFDQNTRVEKVEVTQIFTPPPSLSVEEVLEQIDFPVMLPTWLPENLVYVHRDVVSYDPQIEEGSGKKLSIEYSPNTYFNSGMGLMFLNANDGPITAPPLLAENREQPVTVNGRPGYYVHGGWQDDGRGDPNTKMGNLMWDDTADDAYLTWIQDGVTYLLEAHNLGLGLSDLQRIAESMKRP